MSVAKMYRIARRAEIRFSARLVYGEGTTAILSASWRGVSGTARGWFEGQADEAWLSAQEDWEILRTEALADLEARLDASGWRFEPLAA